LRGDIVSHPVVYGTGIGQVLAQVTGQVFMHYHRAVVAAARSQVLVLERGATESDMENSYSPTDSIRSDKNGKDAAQRQLDTTMLDRTHETEITSEVPIVSMTSDGSMLGGRRVIHREVFERPYHDDLEQLRVRPWVNPAILVMSVLAIGLGLAGCIMPSFSFDASGIIVDAMHAGQGFKHVRDEYSVINIAQLLVSEARFLGDNKYLVGLGLLSALFITMVVAVPILHVCALLMQWFYPLRGAYMNKLHHVAELFHAWQYTEVYVLSCISCAIQLSGVSDFLIGRYCQTLGDALALVVNLGLLDVEGRTCYAVTGSLEDGAVLLLVAVFLIGMVRLFVGEAVDQILASDEVARTHVPYRSAGEDGAEQKKAAMIKRIDCPPVLFAHRFRWFLHPLSE
jgi:Paraquat-inducible protein A